MLNPNIDFNKLSSEFQNAEPFPHVVIDNFFPPELAEELAASFPSFGEDFWYVYKNPIEDKLACNIPEHMPTRINEVLGELNKDQFLKSLTDLTGIEDLKADHGLHGGGMHCIKKGGKLDIHIDYSIHPTLELERRLNLIMYLNKDWNAEYGGYLEFWNDDVSKCIKKVEPIFNRAVIFATGDILITGEIST